MRRLRLSEAFNRPLLVAMVALWLLSALITLLAALIGMTPVAVLAPLFLFLALATALRWRWALALDFVLSAFSGLGVLGSAIELARGGADKAAQLAPLGIDPFYAALLNLVISLAAAVIFGWIVLRLRALR
jgi:hypothetical protein